MKKNRIWFLVMLVSVLISLAFVGCGRSYLMVEEDGVSAGQSEFLSAEAGTGSNSGQVETGSGAGKAEGETGKKSEMAGIEDGQLGKEIFVQVAGAVASPGVYVLSEGARVYELIEMAGGLTLDADDTDLNQAAVLFDGLKIYVYHEGERTAEEKQEILSGTDGSGLAGGNIVGAGQISGIVGGTVDGLVNINTADEKLLCTLPGIGGTRAAAIITYRTQNGRFKSIEDIMLVPGIKDSVYSKVKDYIRV